MGPMKWMLLSLFLMYLLLPEEYNYVRPFILIAAGLVVLAHLPVMYYTQGLLPEDIRVPTSILPYVLVFVLLPLGYMTYTVFKMAERRAHETRKASKKDRK